MSSTDRTGATYTPVKSIAFAYLYTLSESKAQAQIANGMRTKGPGKDWRL